MKPTLTDQSTLSREEWDIVHEVIAKAIAIAMVIICVCLLSRIG